MLERDQHVQFTLRYMISHTTSCQKRKTKNGYLKQVVQLQTNQSHAAHVSDPVNQVYSRLSNLSDNCTCYSQILPPNRVGPEDAINVLLHKKEISFRWNYARAPFPSSDRNTLSFFTPWVLKTTCVSDKILSNIWNINHFKFRNIKTIWVDLSCKLLLQKCIYFSFW
jgi:hypothetical protein